MAGDSIKLDGRALYLNVDDRAVQLEEPALRNGVNIFTALDLKPCLSCCCARLSG
jgi:hypothetical protein